MIAICSMIRKPFNFNTWLNYHFSIGVDYIFLRVEDTPELSGILEDYKDKVFVEYDNSINKQSAAERWWRQMDRQSNFVNKVIKICPSKSVKWLAHIDCDELIWTSKPLKEILLDLDNNIDFITLHNHEAVYPNDSLSNPFLETNQFLRNKYLAYGNGKSIGRVSDLLECKGPHFFEGKRFKISPKLASVLHFESPTFNYWYKKFSEEKSDVSQEMFDKIPFKFYKESISIIREGNLDKCRQFYNKMKVEPYNSDDVVRLFWTPMLEEKNSTWSK